MNVDAGVDIGAPRESACVRGRDRDGRADDQEWRGGMTDDERGVTRGNWQPRRPS